MSPAPAQPDDANTIDDAGWLLRYDGFDPATEGIREALCTLGNGYFATRGAAPEARADQCHYPGTYVAGLYNRRVTDVAGRAVENESIVNVPNWLPLNFRIDDGEWFDLGDRDSQLLDYSQQLDLHRATLTRSIRVSDALGRVTQIEQRRFVSMADPHTACLQVRLTPENWSGTLTVRSGIDGRVINAGVTRYRPFDEHHLGNLTTHVVNHETIGVTARTSQSDVCIAQVARVRAFGAGHQIDVPRRVVTEPGSIAHELAIDAKPLRPVTVEKVVTLFTSRDRAISDPLAEASRQNGLAGSFDGLFADHRSEWDNLWRRFPMEIVVDAPETQMALRLHIFHLLQTTGRNACELDVGLPARGLHGEAYRGHIFWDELFMVPYLNRHYPELVRSLLMYRYRRLPEARAAALEAGGKGAMYPWQSGSNGREEAQVVHLNPLSGHWLPDASHLQRHINVAIAYNLWQYFQATDDVEFMADYGAEILFEISRYWASIAQFDPTLGRYVIAGVMGPDEYHDGYLGASAPGLKDNAYTNVMVAWVLCRSLELVDLLPEPQRRELMDRLSLDKAELARWDDVSRRLRVVFHKDGVISQFEGYGELDELDWGAYRERYGDISRLDRILEGEGDSPNAYKASKQADVLMLFYLLSVHDLEVLFERLGYDCGPDAFTASIDYYLARTSHGSTLSRVVHSWVLARRDPGRSWSLFQQALRSDLDDTQGGTTREGIHLGAMIGTVDLVERCYLGIAQADGMISFSPSLPPAVRCLTVNISHRRRWMKITVADGLFSATVSGRSQEPVLVELNGKTVELIPGIEHQVAL